jgi:hypothetical protein
MWTFWMYEAEKKEEWLLWTRGSLEDCLDELFTFRSGQYGQSYIKARIEVERVTG